MDMEKKKNLAVILVCGAQSPAKGMNENDVMAVLDWLDVKGFLRDKEESLPWVGYLSKEDLKAWGKDLKKVVDKIKKQEYDLLDRIPWHTEGNRNKPPIGIRPRKLHEQDRYRDIIEAITRYMDAGKDIPLAWRTELGYLNERLSHE